MHTVEFILNGRWTLARAGSTMTRSEADALVRAFATVGFIARVAR
jgi:hypothetical protein